MGEHYCISFCADQGSVAIHTHKFSDALTRQQLVDSRPAHLTFQQDDAICFLDFDDIAGPQ